MSVYEISLGPSDSRSKRDDPENVLDSALAIGYYRKWSFVRDVVPNILSIVIVADANRDTWMIDNDACEPRAKRMRAVDRIREQSTTYLRIVNKGVSVPNCESETLG